LAPTTSSCADRSPAILAASYHLVAIDRAADNQPRDGDRATLLVGLASLRPAAPTALTVQTVADGPKLAWNAPATGTVQFYRVHRDGTALADRYDRTAADVRTFTDTGAATRAHTHRATAVHG